MCFFSSPLSAHQRRRGVLAASCAGHVASCVWPSSRGSWCLEASCCPSSSLPPSLVVPTPPMCAARDALPTSTPCPSYTALSPVLVPTCLPSPSAQLQACPLPLSLSRDQPPRPPSSPPPWPAYSGCSHSFISLVLRLPLCRDAHKQTG